MSRSPAKSLDRLDGRAPACESFGAAIECENLVKRFDDVAAVDGVSLKLPQGQVLALLGPSGCGKTTLLRLIAGFERPDSGRIAIREREVVGASTWIAPDKRRIGFVFQDYALFPHLSVQRNVAFGLKGRRDAASRAGKMLELVGLESAGDRLPHELSGGQQQRVALARALAPDPDVILLDEPFSNLDAALRRQVRHDLMHILSATGKTAIFVTHDQEEALNVGTSIAVMNHGRLLEVGSPHDVYLSPQSHEAAQIVGAANFLPAQCQEGRARCALGNLEVARTCPGGPMSVLLRPEAIALAKATAGSVGAEATVESLQFHGNHQHVFVRLAEGTSLRVRTDPRQEFHVGERVVARAAEPVITLAER
jgi:iron(III) transport system ATP-binding protein